MTGFWIVIALATLMMVIIIGMIYHNIISCLVSFIAGAVGVFVALWAFTSWGELSGLGLIPLIFGGLSFWTGVQELRAED
ncbi:hypothetical protein JZU46_01370 [bacterium]|nr:hypothetical protein [bacterium]